MTNGSPSALSRATTIAVCSGKGGVGKSTVALFVASRLAEAGKRTLLIDTDFGFGDITTMTNLTPLVGFEQMLSGAARLEDALLHVGPKLSIMGTLPGSSFDIASLTRSGLDNCRKIDAEFEVIVFDTPSTLDSFNLGIIAASDLAISVTTSRIPAIADSYVQLKKITGSGSRAAICFLVNQVDTEVEGMQATAKFAELLDRFLGRKVPSVGMIENEPNIEKAVEGQSLLELSRRPGGFGKKAELVMKTLLDKHLKGPRTGCSIWEQMSSTIFLKNEISFDDNKLLVQVQG